MNIQHLLACKNNYIFPIYSLFLFGHFNFAAKYSNDIILYTIYLSTLPPMDQTSTHNI